MKIIDGVLKSKEDVCMEHRGIIYKHAHSLAGVVPLEDLVSEGYIGLLKAYDKYDESKNIKFVTYGGRLAYLSMLTFMKNSTSGAYYPHQIRDLASKIRKRNLQNHSVEELMAMWGNTRNAVTGALLFLDHKDPESLSEVRRDTESATLADAIPSPDDDTWIYTNEFRDKLNSREKFVLDHLLLEKNCREISEMLNRTTSAIQVNVRNMRVKYNEYMGVV